MRIEGVPLGEVLGLRGVHGTEAAREGFGQLEAQGFDFLLQGQLLVAALDGEVAVVGVFDFLFDGGNEGLDEEVFVREGAGR